MAVTKLNTFVAPSMDVRSKDDLDSIQIESGMYYCSESITLNTTDIDGETIQVTSSNWSILCISNEDATNLICRTQFWIDNVSNKVLVRTIKPTMDAYNNFRLLVYADELQEHVINKATNPTEIYIQATSPGVQSGVNRIWINDSTN